MNREAIKAVGIISGVYHIKSTGWHCIVYVLMQLRSAQVSD